MTKILRAVGLKKYFLAHAGWWSKLLAPKSAQPEYIKAVDGISLDIYQGELLGLLGESGSGKTTLIRTMLRLTTPTAGEVWFEERNIFKLSSAELKQTVRRRLRMIFQHPDAVLNPAYTVQMVLEQALRTHTTLQNSERDERSLELLHHVGLSRNYLGKHPHELSGGEKRRITICRALATNPTIIFADEPLSGLDVSLQRQVLELLLKIRAEQNLTLALITHDIEVVRKACDRIAIMYAGRIVELGRKDGVSPKHSLHPYTQTLFASRLNLDANSENKKPLPVDWRDIEVAATAPQKGCPYLPSCSLWREKGKPDLCRHENPALAARNNDHQVACHFAE